MPCLCGDPLCPSCGVLQGTMPMPNPWIRCSRELPPIGLIVETKIDDAHGVRNIQPLKRDGRLWFFPDDSMYVYYTPTHWRRIED